LAAIAALLVSLSLAGNAAADQKLVCIGALSGAHIYTTYGYVGGTADLYAAQSYTAERVQELMKEVVGLSDVCIKELEKVKDSEGVTEEDKATIDKVIEVYQLLKQEATALSDYSKSQDKDDLDKLESARTTVWPKIKDVLGIK
jgi:hypothetical protein